MVRIVIKKEYNKRGEFEVTFISFKGKYQTPLIMIIREYWYEDDLVFVKAIWSTKWF